MFSASDCNDLLEQLFKHALFKADETGVKIQIRTFMVGARLSQSNRQQATDSTTLFSVQIE